MITSKSFTCASEAQEFGLSLRARGIEPRVCVHPAVTECYAQRPDSAAAEAEIVLFSERGEELGSRALAWAQASPWWEGEGSLSHAVECLDSDLEDGITNGAASRAQAGLFLKRLEAALARAPKKRVRISAASPPSWDIFWDDPTPTPSTDSDECWGASVGSNGWRCD